MYILVSGISSLLGQRLFLETGIVYTKAIKQEEVYSNNWKEEADVSEVEEIEGWVALGMIYEIDRYIIPDLWSIFRIWDIILIQKEGIRIEKKIT